MFYDRKAGNYTNEKPWYQCCPTDISCENGTPYYDSGTIVDENEIGKLAFCPKCRSCNPGYALYYANSFSSELSCRPIPINHLLLDQRVNHFNADISVSLVWQRKCDLDLHVFEPSGFEIFYRNKTSDYGVLNYDNTNGASGIGRYAVENISFETAPVGCYKVAVTNYVWSDKPDCKQGVDYTYFIKLGDNTSVYQKRTPVDLEGYGETIVIAEFCWSAGGRNAMDIDLTDYPYEFSEARKELGKLPKEPVSEEQ